jgi:hypothetical protein
MRHLSVRIESDLLHKLHYVASYEGRSANGQILYLIRKSVEAFEKEQGKIELGAPPDKAKK